jgi:AMP-binding enzyme
MHSSGLTGMPKPIFWTHERCLKVLADGFGLSALVTLPLHHAYGFCSFFRSLHGRTLYSMFNCRLPLTADNVAKVVEKLRPEMISVLPYTLQRDDIAASSRA